MGRRGVFLVFEGCDRAGKTTQCKKLVDALIKRGIAAEYLNFPDRSTAIGKIIDDYLTKKIELPDKAVHLLFSANRWELEPIIKQKLSSGVSLIVDRYSYSGVAFSAAKQGMNLNWCWNPEVGLPEPDAVLLLNLAEEVSAKRGDFGKERYEVSDFQKEVKKNFMHLKTSLWKSIDADKSVEDLHAEILTTFSDIYEKTAGNPLSVFEANSDLQNDGASTQTLSESSNHKNHANIENKVFS